ncbi:hypothetical protein [Neolewinella persica]|uniref:hypothetical protein n=1 Tax=Neolewinella persica TaxID=70998 RepID=UPI0012FBE572|nr:hypothetical protein [Neolewinella persica]
MLHRGSALIRGGWILFLFLSPFAFMAQENQSSPMFPAERHQELREDLAYEQKKQEEEKLEEDLEKWWNFEAYENWSFDLSSGTSIVILVLLLAGLGFLIFRILGDVEMRKRTREAGEEQDEINIDDLEEEVLVAEGVSVSLLERAERAGQYDVAVRLLYIQLLKELQDGGLIKYRRDFSNRDYQQQLRHTAFLQDFREVTANYERFWYGKYPIERLGYRLVYGKFTTLNAAIQAATAKPDPYV